MMDVKHRLFDAVKRNDVDDLAELFRNGANINVTNAEQRTLLHVAAENNHVESAEKLLEFGADLEAISDDNGTPLLDAAAWGHDEMVAFLINKGARGDIVSSDGWSILFWAVYENHPSTLLLILQYFPQLIDQDDLLPLNVAKTSSVVKLLLEHGAKANKKDRFGDTALHAHAVEHDIESIRLLLRYGANILEENDLGETPLWLAQASRNGEIFRYLHAVVNPPKARDQKKDHSLNTTISLHCHDSSTLAQELIVEHARRRVDLFFYTLIAYYQTGLNVQISKTISQHGKGNKTANTNACHSAILPALWDTKQQAPTHAWFTRYNPGVREYQTGILDHTDFYHSLNSTVELDCSVNYLDTHWIEGRTNQVNKMRYQSLLILNEVSKGNMNPLQGMSWFLTRFMQRMVEIYAGYFRMSELPTSPVATRPHIFACQYQGTFENSHWNNNGMLELNEDYIRLMLRLDQHKTPEDAYVQIKAEIGVPMVTTGLLVRGVFARKNGQGISGEDSSSLAMHCSK